MNCFFHVKSAFISQWFSGQGYLLFGFSLSFADKNAQSVKRMSFETALFALFPRR